ncbi:hypothetical protein QJS04_geneDACA006369 [Acorus gramineus]|uniref:Cell wall hydroxyproline-rich glycoprotein n=1 Tax=Acorus gramineus TaxID=55184 RepID=A0AAV9AX11_ACOGR|nr:hypothetical protein QJS04_geneDACA006369 [Acorus gramineus]
MAKMFKILLFITLLVLLNPNPSISSAPTPHGYHPLPSHGAYPPEDLSPPPLPPPPPPQPPLDPKLEAARTVILQFKSTITSDPLGVTNTWLSGNSPCNYTGFFCGNPPKENQTTTIASIDFNGFGLAAPTVSGFLDQFTELALFHANSNNFSGYLPDVSNLQYLYELDLSNNKLSGKFPMEVLQITDPVFLDLRYNNFYGVVPPQVFTLPLDVLFINNNAFDNYIPHNLGATSAIYLTLANNHFTGPIPGSIKNVSSTLKEVLFLNNDLTGCLPFQIGYLKNTTVFDAGGNRLTGPIPCSFGCLTSIQQLNLAGNQLYGKVLEEVCALGSLQNLSLSDNYFTELGPTCQSLVGSVVNVDKNCIPALPNQRSPAECHAFLARPKYCPTRWGPDNVPCKLPSQGTPVFEAPPPPPPPPALSPAYSALVKHKRRRIL